MKFRIGKKMLLLLMLILAVTCTSVGVVTAEETGTITEVKLVSDSEVVALTTRTITDQPTPGNTAAPAPIIEKFVDGQWVKANATEFTWSSTATWAAPVNSQGVVPYAASNQMDKVTITGKLNSNESLTVSYTVYPCMAIATKADLDALAQKTGLIATDGNAWYKSRCYALAADIDYGANGALWHERYMYPIASNVTDNEFESGKVLGIFGSAGNNVNGSIHQTRFGARLEGQGYSIKNAIIPLGQAFYKDSSAVYGAVWSNWIGRLWGGTVKDIKFENLTFESATQAAANPYMYTVANNANLQGRFTDSDNNGVCDTTGIPVINDGNGNVVQIDVAKMVRTNNNGLQDKMTISHRSGLIGKLECGLVDGIYMDVNTNSMAGFYDSVSRDKASGLVVGCLISDGSYNSTYMARDKAQIQNVIVVPKLTEGNGYFGVTYSTRWLGGILGVAKVSGSVALADDVIYNCAVLIESNSNLLNATGLGVLAGWNSGGGAIIDAYHTNTKVFKVSGSNSALSQLKADTSSDAVDFTVFAKHDYWNMADVATSVYQGEYGTAPSGDVNYATIVFGQLDLDFVSLSEIEEYGIELKRWTPDGTSYNTLYYQFKFNEEGKVLTSDNRFAIALYDLPMTDDNVAGDEYKAYVYVKLADGTTIYSANEVEFSIAQ